MDRTLKDAEAFAKAYKPSEDDHPDLQSRVVMYRRAVKSGSTRAIAAHARTLTRFARNVGALEPESETRRTRKAAASSRTRKTAASGSGDGS